MEKKKKIIIIASVIGVLFLLAIISLVFSSGGAPTIKPTGPVTVRIWKPFVDSSQMDGLINAYTQKNPLVTIEYTKKACSDSACSDYQDDVLNALARGDGPDIFSIHNSWLPQYIDKLEPATDKTFTFKAYRDTFVDTVVQDFTFGQKIYGTVLGVDSLGLYYNKDLLADSGIPTPPKTWRELEVQVQKLTRTDRRTGYIRTSGVAIGTSANVYRPHDILYLFMLQRGSKPWSSDGIIPTFADSVEKNGTFINPGYEALKFYTSFATPTSPNYTWNARSDQSIDAFVNGRAAMMYGYSFTAETIKQKNPNLNFQVALVPQPNLEDPRVDFANYWGEVVSKQTKNAAVVWDFLKFITSKEQLDKYYAAYKQPASRRDLIAVQEDDPDIGVFAHANLTAKAFYRPDEARMEKIIREAIDNVILRGFNSEQAILQAQTQAGALTRNGF